MKVFSTIILLSCVVLLLISGCRCDNIKEIYRETSPEQSVDVVVIRKDCASLSSTSYHLYIVLKGDIPTDRDKIFESDRTYDDIQVKWISPKLLMISHGRAYIQSYKNYWYPPINYGEGWTPSKEIRVRLYEYENKEK